MISQGEFNMAKTCFVDCINAGKTYDARIRQECCNQLRMLLARDSIVDYRLEKLA